MSIDIANPKLGDTIAGHHLGYKNRSRLVYVSCPSCEKSRWVLECRPTKHCRDCSAKRTVKYAQAALAGKSRPDVSARQRGADNHMWKGGRVGAGRHQRYIYVLIPPEHPYASMAIENGYVMEHRLNMAMHLGRLLHPWEQVHHLNGNRQDNRIENLELWKHSQPSGVRQADYHCVGCRCFEKEAQ